MFLLANGTTLFYSCFKVVLRLFRVDFRTTLFCIHFMVVLRLFRYRVAGAYANFERNYHHACCSGVASVVLPEVYLDRYRTTLFGEVVPGLFHRYAQIAVWNNVVPNVILE